MTSSKFNTALDVIEDLVETISWLGGDSYEMDCISKSLNEAGEFLETHRPPKKENTVRYIDDRTGIYTTKDNKGLIVRAYNRRNAKNKLGVRLDLIKCIKVPKI